MSVLLTIGDALVLVAICLGLLFVIVVTILALFSICKSVWDAWKDGADND